MQHTQREFHRAARGCPTITGSWEPSHLRSLSERRKPIAAIIVVLMRWQDPRAAYWLAGGIVYLVGTIVVTMVCNVPRNNALAELAPESPEAAKYWLNYLSTWTAWNHVRTIAPLVSAALFTWAFRLRG